MHRDSNFISPEQVNLPSSGTFNGFKGQEHGDRAFYCQFEGVYLGETDISYRVLLQDHMARHQRT